MDERSLADRRAAFESITKPLMGPLYRTALGLTHQPEDAKDVVQETYLRAYRTFGSFTPGTNARAWLFTILHSVHINRYRKDRRTPQHVSIEDLGARFDHLLAETSPLDLIPSGTTGTEKVGREIDAALGALPEVYRSAVSFFKMKNNDFCLEGFVHS